jgi:hypothetical protein
MAWFFGKPKTHAVAFCGMFGGRCVLCTVLAMYLMIFLWNIWGAGTGFVWTIAKYVLLYVYLLGRTIFGMD